MDNAVFAHLPLPKAILRLAVPTMAGNLVTILYNLADTFFVGQTGDEFQVAAVTLTSPVFMALTALGILFGIGGGSFISRQLGERKPENACKASALCFWGSLGLGVLFLAAGLLLLPQLVTLLGASAETYAFTLDYLRIILLGSPAILLSNTLGQLIRAEGAAKHMMLGMMLGTVVNIALDPLFIFTLRMGVAGAALATVLSNLLSVAYYVRYFLRKSACLSVSPRLLSPDGYICKSILLIGVPAFINNILITVAQILLNNHAAAYGDDVVAALGIVSRTTSLPVLLLIGLAQGVQPLIAYNYAAGNRKRLTGTMKLTALSGTALALLLAVLLYALAGPVVSAFLDKAEVVRLGVRFLRVNVCSVPFLASLFLLMNVFQGMGKALPSLILSICRKGVIFLPLLLLGDIYYGLNGIVWAQPAADILSTFIAARLFLLLYRAPKHAAVAKPPLRMSDSSDSSDPSDSSRQDSPS